MKTPPKRGTPVGWTYRGRFVTGIVKSSSDFYAKVLRLELDGDSETLKTHDVPFHALTDLTEHVGK